MEDMIEAANEIQESLGRSYGVPDEIDEAELEAGKYTMNGGCSSHGDLVSYPELEALQVEEEETPSYLQDINVTPDFIDEAPLEEKRVSSCGCSLDPGLMEYFPRQLTRKPSELPYRALE